VGFRIDSPSGDHDADGPMFDLWEKYRRRHTEHVKEFAKRLIALYRGVTWLPGMPFSADRSKKEILKLTKRATIMVYRTEFQGKKYYSLEARFELGWDDEHRYALPFDEETETFGPWQD
jgi:hypothetical protein